MEIEELNFYEQNHKEFLKVINNSVSILENTINKLNTTLEQIRDLLNQNEWSEIQKEMERQQNE